jgi:Fe-S cluster biosynthesis and repair protein YggX
VRDSGRERFVLPAAQFDKVALDFPKMDGLNIGMSIYQDIGGDSWKVWIDEIAVDTKRIGCSF